MDTLTAPLTNNESIRHEFPLFQKHPELVYLDSAATALKPKAVIDAVSGYYETLSTNVGRGLYPLAEATTEQVEAARARVARFIGAQGSEIIFTRGTTESINLLASSLAPSLRKGDNIVVTEMEHHSNFLPWQRLAAERGLEFRILPIGKEGGIERESLEKIIDHRTALLSVSAVSNVLGTRNDIEMITDTVKKIRSAIIVVVDAAQMVGHEAISVSQLGADYIAFSGHKMFGPTGVGILWGRQSLLESLPPYQLGGGMVIDACAELPQYKPVPYRFEAGTPDIASILGLGAAIDFIEGLGIDAIRAHEIDITRIALEKLHAAFGEEITVYGPTDADNRGGLISFTLAGVHPHDIAQTLGEENICVRAGEHCAAPLHRALKIPATARASFSVYTTGEDIDRLILGLERAKKTFTK